MEKCQGGELSSTSSVMVSLEAVRTGRAGLNEHRKKLLERVPESGNWIKQVKDSITTKDIAYLSAATLHEFALLRGKKEDILFHGTERHCMFDGELCELLKSGKLRLIAHTHPDRGQIVPSIADRDFLKMIGQGRSIIVSFITGEEREFSSNLFDDIL